VHCQNAPASAVDVSTNSSTLTNKTERFVTNDKLLAELYGKHLKIDKLYLVKS